MISRGLRLRGKITADPLRQSQNARFGNSGEAAASHEEETIDLE
jgi:hypothetical protein